MKKSILTTAFLYAAFTHTAQAQVAELRVGLTEFDERSLNLRGDSFFRADENSLGINAEIIFEEPEFLKWALTPQPYINGTLNLGGKTSFAGGGLLWRQNLGKKFYADFAFGGVIHSGTKDVKFPGPFPSDGANSPADELEAFAQDSREFFRQLDTEIEFGSRLLFREQVTLGMRVNDDWAAEIFYEHLSNAGLSENGKNDGVDNLGIKVARRF